MKKIFDAQRREFLRASAGSVSLTALGGGASLLAMDDAHAQTDYKALVCVFLYGGNDGFNMVIPSGTAYTDYAKLRGFLTVPQASAQALNADFGFHPALAPLMTSWNASQLGVVLNVGVLARPTTQAEFVSTNGKKGWEESNDTTLCPPGLFSHSDQQILAEIGATDPFSIRTGWGGRLADALSAGNIYSFAGTSRFAGSTKSTELALPGPGSTFGPEGFGWSDKQNDARKAALQALVGAATSANHVQAAFQRVQKTGFTFGSLLEPILKQAPTASAADPANPEISAAFGNLQGALNNDFARQLYQVAKMIKNRSTLGGGRHIYFVSMGGFDNHDNQVPSTNGVLETGGNHYTLLARMAGGMAAFQKAMNDLAVSNNVTTFTMSDFGRTSKPNTSLGSDHGWGGVQLVMGGAVNGKATYGRYPQFALGKDGGKDDCGVADWSSQGRWIPSVATDQMAGTLINWFAPTIDAGTILPNLKNFDVSASNPYGKNLGFMKAA
ncbi:MAG: DUF1501 domain-containing protein [Burkholderiaceae bacterium]